jgi:DNA-binding transcriptional MerR regulator
MDKSPEAFRTISEVAESLETPAHVLRFWESRFPQIKPVKRAGGRRYYRPADVALLSGIRHLLHNEGMTIRGVQKILREQGVRHVAGLAGGEAVDFEAEALEGDAAPDLTVTADIHELTSGRRSPVTPDAPMGAVVQLHPAAAVVPDVAPDLAPGAEAVPEAGHVWVEDEPELSLDPPVNLFDAAVPAPQDDPPPPMLSGLTARIRALPRPLSSVARAELEELHSRLGLLHAQIAEAQRLRR